MRQFSKQVAKQPLNEENILETQIQDLTKFQNKLKQHDEQQSVRDMSRNRLQGSKSANKGDGLSTGGTMESKQSSRTGTSRPVKSPIPETTGKSTPSTIKAKVKPLNMTSAAQLQVYLKPEYKNYTEVLKPRNPQQIRPKR